MDMDTNTGSNIYEGNAVHNQKYNRLTYFLDPEFVDVFDCLSYVLQFSDPKLYNLLSVPSFTCLSFSTPSLSY
jgi:hypothetical protein